MNGRLAVVGGGLAGIAAALAAADAGAEVVLLERRNHLGGLTTSIRRHGLSFDNGQHVFLRCCTEYRSLLERIGASSQVVLQRRLDVPVLRPGGSTASIRRTSLPAPLHLGAALAGYRHLSALERARLGRAAFALRRLDPDDASLDGVSFGSWLRRHGQDDRAIERLWNLIALPTLNVAAEEASLKLAAKVFKVGLLEHRDAGDIGWSSVPLSELHGANAARSLAEAGVDVVLGTPVTSIEPAWPSTFTVATVARRLEAGAVVVATPLPAAATLGALEDPGRVEALGSSPIVNVHLVLDRKVTDLPFAACVDSPVQFVFDRTASSGLASGQCLAVSLSAADSYVDVGASTLVEQFTEALSALFPSMRQARLLDGLVTRERTATFRGRPGSHVSRPAVTTRTPGLFLAGASCDTGWPATMEGAVRSGREAAAGALTALGGDHERPVQPLEEAVG